jgi:hypothetical protein
MFLDNLFGKSNKKKNSFDSLFEEVEQTNSIDKSKNKTKTDSFYGDDKEEEFDFPIDNQKTKNKKKGFYGLDLLSNKKDKEPIEQSIFHFSWWEYVIILTEFILLIYVILLFAGVVSI